MLVASRDPFHSEAQDASSPKDRGSVSQLARAMTGLQIVGTLLAVPVGIGSAYSMYRANFSVETTCRSLRGNIVAMLDKGVDATTRHMLVRRDVEAFERTCGVVDPDATAAFKVLLAAEKTTTPVATAAARPVEMRAEPATRKAESHPPVAAKQTAEIPPKVTAQAAPAPREASSDTVWIAAVRRALVTHGAEPPPPAEALKVTAVAPAPPAEPVKSSVVISASPAAPPILRAIRPSDEVRVPAISLAPSAPTSAPALPPATSVAIAPAPQADDGHPVPPESIPDTAKTEEHTRSRLGELAAQIPLLGWAFDR
jgi:hypothetical protein